MLISKIILLAVSLAVLATLGILREKPKQGTWAELVTAIAFGIALIVSLAFGTIGVIASETGLS